MSRHEPDATTIAAALELLTAHGFDGLARPLEMLLERTESDPTSSPDREEVPHEVSS